MCKYNGSKLWPQPRCGAVPVSHPIPAVWDMRARPRRAPGCCSAFDLQKLLSRKLSVLFIKGKKQLGLYKGFCCSSSPSQHCQQEAGASQCHPYPHAHLPKGLPSLEQGDAPISQGVGRCHCSGFAPFPRDPAVSWSNVNDSSCTHWHSQQPSWL